MSKEKILERFDEIDSNVAIEREKFPNFPEYLSARES